MQLALWQPPECQRSREQALASLEQTAARARALGASWLLAPEFFLPGTAASEALRTAAEPSDGPFAQGVANIARRHRMAIATGYVECAFSNLFSVALCVDAAGIAIAHYRRVHLQPGEEAYLAAGEWATLVPAQDARMGILLGADLLVPEAARLLVLAGASLLFALGRPAGLDHERLRAVARTRALENGVPLALTAAAGRDEAASDSKWAGLFAASGQEVALVRAAQDLWLAPLVAETSRSQLPRRRPELYRILSAAPESLGS